MDQRSFENRKINRWQEELSNYKFVIQYLEGENNGWADLLSRPNGQKRTLVENDPTPAGRFYKLEGTGLRFYVPSWTCADIDEDELRLTRFTAVSHKLFNKFAGVAKIDADFKEIPRNDEYMNIHLAQNVARILISTEKPSHPFSGYV